MVIECLGTKEETETGEWGAYGLPFHSMNIVYDFNRI